MNTSYNLLQKGKETVCLRIQVSRIVHQGFKECIFHIQPVWMDPEWPHDNGLTFYTDYYDDAHKYGKIKIESHHFPGEFDQPRRMEFLVRDATNPNGIPYEEAAETVKAIRKIQLKLERYTKKDGLPMDFCDRVVRIAKALNAKHFYFDYATANSPCVAMYRSKPIKDLYEYLKEQCRRNVEFLEPESESV